MSGSRIYFFADDVDLSILFERFNKVGALLYTEGLSKTNEPSVQFADAKNLIMYTVSHDAPLQSNVFLVTKESSAIFFRDIKMKDDSGIKKAASQIFNPNSVEILLGGEAAPATLVAHDLRTTGETKEAKRLFVELKKIVISSARKISQYYILPNSSCKLESGWRLAQAIDFPASADIKLE